MTIPRNSRRPVEEIEGAWFICFVVVLIGIAWSIVAIIA
jgi:hypothetical protein